MLRRINQALPELILGIVLFGMVIQLTGIWFVADKLRYSTGLWIGIAMAVAMAIHMAVVLEDAMNLVIENKARNRVMIQSFLRYFVIIVIFLLVMYFRLGNLLTLFVGVMGLKAGAFLQPFTHKAIKKLSGKGKESLDSEKM